MIESNYGVSVLGTQPYLQYSASFVQQYKNNE